MTTTTTTTTLAIVGSRSFSDYAMLKRKIDEFYPNEEGIIKLIVSGGAKGADTMAERYALENKIKMKRLRPNWRNEKGVYNPRAGFERNKEIVSCSDHVVAFWDNKSTGTRDSINHAKRLGKRLDVIIF